MINVLKEDANKQMTKVGKSFQDLDEKISNIDEKFIKEIEIEQKKPTNVNVGDEKLNKSNEKHSRSHHQ
jgi:uncharacterized lipoprotein YehR (DUF1307 family)